MFRNRFFGKLLHNNLFKFDQVKLVYLLSPLVGLMMDAFRKTDAWNLPVPDKRYYVGFISKSRIFSTYRELLIEFSEE